MALTPNSFEEVEVVEEETEVVEASAESGPSKTFSLGGKRLGGQIDGDEAIRQYIDKAIRTARSNYLIYDDSYGSEVDYLIGQSLPLSVLEIEMPRLIEEALIYDDRIASVGNFALSQVRDGLHVEFTVTLTNGESIDSEVIL